MRSVDLGHGVFAFEPDGIRDRVGTLNPERLRSIGLSDAAIKVYRRYSAPALRPGATAGSEPAGLPDMPTRDTPA